MLTAELHHRPLGGTRASGTARSRIVSTVSPTVWPVVSSQRPVARGRHAKHGVEPSGVNEVYSAYESRIRDYCARRADAKAADLVAEVSTVAWRRIDDLPHGDQSLVWL